MKPFFRQVGCLYLFIICLIFLLLTGCPSGVLPPIISPRPESKDMTFEEVSQFLAQRAADFRNLRGRGKVHIQTWKENYKFSEIFILETPTSFRLETLGFLEQPEVFLTSNEDTLLLYTKKHNTAYKGVASQENLFKLSGINLSVEDTIQVLSGNPPRLATMNFEWGMFLKDINRYYVERVSLQDNIIQRIWFDPSYRVIANIQENRLSNGELLLDIQFETYRAETGTYSIPEHIRIDRPLDKTQVDIRYKSFDVNQSLDQTVFKFDPPVDAIIRYIDDQTAEQIERLAPYKEFQVEEQ